MKKTPLKNIVSENREISDFFRIISRVMRSHQIWSDSHKGHAIPYSSVFFGWFSLDMLRERKCFFWPSLSILTPQNWQFWGLGPLQYKPFHLDGPIILRAFGLYIVGVFALFSVFHIESCLMFLWSEIHCFLKVPPQTEIYLNDWRSAKMDGEELPLSNPLGFTPLLGGCW